MIIGARSSLDRKPELQIITMVASNDGRRSVRKRAANPTAQKHLDSMVDKQEKLARELKGINTIAVERDGDELVMEFLDAVSLDDDFRTAVLERDVDTMISVIERVFDLIDTQDTQEVDFKKATQFHKYFGSAYNSKLPALMCGYYDFNPDNVLVHKSVPYLIDYEFTYDFPLPVELVKSRMLLIYLSRYSYLFKSLANENLPIIEVGEELFVPEEIYEKYSSLFERIAKTVKSESHFQSQVGLKSVEITVHPKKDRVRHVAPAIDFVDARLKTLTTDKRTLTAQVASLEKTIEDQAEVTKTLQESVHRYQSFLPIKIARKLRSLVSR